MRVALVSAEITPFAKTGGLGDVCAALVRWLSRAGHDVRPFLPWYGNLRDAGQSFAAVDFVREVPVAIGGRQVPFTLWATTMPGTKHTVYLVRCAEMYGRPSIYTSDGDEALRFAYLTKAALESCQRVGFSPDILHVHDWHAALGPLLVKTAYAWDAERFGRTKSVLTVHNVGYQGTTGARTVEEVGLGPWRHFCHQDHLARDRFSFLEHGILYADAVTTVSRTHAKEMLTAEYGMGMEWALRHRAESFVGIVNGIDTAEWDPSADPRLPARYSADDLSGKAVCKKALLESMGVEHDASAPVFGVVSRLVFQKGFDLGFEVLPRLLAHTNARLVVLGSGEERYLEFFRGLEQRFRGRMAFRTGVDEVLAHRIEAGADLFLMPSLYEPCGLNQMYSLRYGTIPVVRRTGGLADTVVPWDPASGTGNGFVFEHYAPEGFEWALGQALAAWRDPAAWARLVRNAMAADWSWDRQIREYEALYARLSG